MSLLSIHCRPNTAYHRRQNHHYCRGDRGPDQPCYCGCHFPEPARTWECTHNPRNGDTRPIALPSLAQLRSWAGRARFSLRQERQR